MTALGSGPERLVTLIENEWSASRQGRADVPPVIKRETQGEDPRNNRGVLVLRNREDVAVDYAKHDLIHAYAPEANPPSRTDQGYKEENLIETVQLDLEVTDRTDAVTGERLSARDRMISSRDELASFSEPPYPGIAGEVKYILELVRRGLDEWDIVRHDFVRWDMGNSNADVSVNVELEQIARNTVV